MREILLDPEIDEADLLDLTREECFHAGVAWLGLAVNHATESGPLRTAARHLPVLRSEFARRGMEIGVRWIDDESVELTVLR